jgi:hypothetical protein
MRAFVTGLLAVIFWLALCSFAAQQFVVDHSHSIR